MSSSSVSSNKTRSPNYPYLSLGESIEAVGPVYTNEKRARFPRSSLATHLGYGSMNGRALAKIGALRAFRLIDGREDTLSVSPIAIALLEAPKDSADYLQALQEAFDGPSLFTRIQAEHGDAIPSPQSLRWWLAKQGFVGDAADKAMRVYLASVELLTAAKRAVNLDAATSDTNQEAADSNDIDGGPLSKQGPTADDDSRKPVSWLKTLSSPPTERVLISGVLSKTATFKLIVDGHIGRHEIERLIQKLEIDKEILADNASDYDGN